MRRASTRASTKQRSEAAARAAGQDAARHLPPPAGLRGRRVGAREWGCAKGVERRVGLATGGAGAPQQRCPQQRRRARSGADLETTRHRAPSSIGRGNFLAHLYTTRLSVRPRLASPHASPRTRPLRVAPCERRLVPSPLSQARAARRRCVVQMMAPLPRFTLAHRMVPRARRSCGARRLPRASQRHSALHDVQRIGLEPLQVSLDHRLKHGLHERLHGGEAVGHLRCERSGRRVERRRSARRFGWPPQARSVRPRARRRAGRRARGRSRSVGGRSTRTRRCAARAYLIRDAHLEHAAFTGIVLVEAHGTAVGVTIDRLRGAKRREATPRRVSARSTRTSREARTVRAVLAAHSPSSGSSARARRRGSSPSSCTANAGPAGRALHASGSSLSRASTWSCGRPPHRRRRS